MSTDYQAACMSCREEIHLGQCMAGKLSFGFGSNDTETPPKILGWIDEHLGRGHRVQLFMGDSPDEFTYVEI